MSLYMKVLFTQEQNEEEEGSMDPRQVEDLHREAMRKKWKVEEELNATKKDLHYQDVLYDGEEKIYLATQVLVIDFEIFHCEQRVQGLNGEGPLPG